MIDLELKKRVGQMIMAGFPTSAPDEQVTRLTEDFLVGNFVLFKRNFVNSNQTGKMCEGLSRIAFEKTGLAPIISTDQEGGSTCRCSEGAALIPGAMCVSAGQGDGKWLGESCARILTSLGVNTDLAPVLDVNSDPMNPIIGVRSFGDKVETVAKYGLDELCGMQKGGLLATIKHYPGHGNVNSDSHLTLPHNDAPASELYSVDFEPFRRAIASGADALMTCHVVFKSIDPDNPATLSKRIMTGLLREEMGFDGIAMTDCIEMNAIKETYGMGEGAVRAIEAGCDMLCVSHTYEAVKQAAEAVYAALESGRLTRERIDLSYERILRVKRKYGLDKPFVFDAQAARQLVTEPERIKKTRAINRAAITRMVGPSRKIALSNPVFLSPFALSMTRDDNPDNEPDCLAREAQKRFGGEKVIFPLGEYNEEVARQVDAAQGDVYVLGVYNARFRPTQCEVYKQLKQKNKPVIVVLMGAPYDIMYFRDADEVLCAYEYTSASIDAVLDALSEDSYSGVLPVRL